MKRNFNIQPYIRKLVTLSMALLVVFLTAVTSLADNDAMTGATPGIGFGSGKTVVVGYFDTEGLMNGGKDGAEKSGYIYEYIQEIAGVTGWKYEYVYGDFPELYQKLLDGEIDMLPYISKSAEREELLLFPEMEMGSESFYLASREGDWLSGDLSELQGATVGTIENAFQNQIFSQLLEEKGITCKIRYYSEAKKVWKAMANGKLDYSIESNMIYQDTEVHAVYKIDDAIPFYLALAKDRNDLLAEINMAQEKLVEVNPALLDNLKQKYFGAIPLFQRLPAHTIDWLDAHKTIRVGTIKNRSAYVLEGRNGKITGIFPEYFSLMLEKVGADYTVEYIVYDTDQEAVEGLRNGEVDCINPYYHKYSDAEKDGLIISGTVYESNMSVLYRGNYGNNTMEVVAVPESRFCEGYVKDNYPDSTVLPCADDMACIDALLAGKATCVVMDSDALGELTRNSNKNFHIKVLNVQCEVCFATIPENAALIAGINSIIPYVSDLDINEIENRYGAEENTKSADGFFDFIKLHPETSSGIVAIILAVALIDLIFRRRSEKEHRKKLEAAMEEAEKANKAKTDFLFNMSHDIRTPMNAILGFTDMAKKNLDDTEKVKDCLDKTQQAGGLLLSLINSVLEMSRIESGKAELEEVPGRVTYSFAGIESTMRELAEKKNIDLTFEFGDVTDNYVYVDVNRANRVFINIISNAIKYTENGGRVRVRCEQTGREGDCGIYRYTFEDNGIGMSEEFQTSMFDEFARENSTTISGVQGSGLGLSVSKSFVELMGGTIDQQSEKGVGTTFIITLPLKLQENEKEFYIEPKSGMIVSTSGEEKTDRISLAGKRVLLVEDNELNREIADFILSDEGMTVEEAGDGTDAVDLLNEKGPEYYDVILMDIQMPVMDGYEATRRIREMYPDSGLPIIALSANAFAEDKSASIAVGMNDHIAKPINTEELLVALSKCIR